MPNLLKKEEPKSKRATCSNCGEDTQFGARCDYERAKVRQCKTCFREFRRVREREDSQGMRELRDDMLRRIKERENASE